jgi:hypothetical protein
VLTDLCGLAPGEAIASVSRTAATLTKAAFASPADAQRAARPGTQSSQPS